VLYNYYPAAIWNASKDDVIVDHYDAATAPQIVFVEPTEINGIEMKDIPVTYDYIPENNTDTVERNL